MEYIKRNLSEEESKGFVYYEGIEVARKTWIDYEDGSKLRPIGTYFPDSGVLRLNRDNLKMHIYRKKRAFGIDANMLTNNYEENLKIIVLYAPEVSTLFEVDIKTVESACEIVEHGIHGLQYMIPLERWIMKHEDGALKNEEEIRETVMKVKLISGMDI